MLEERRRCDRGLSLRDEEDAVESVEEARFVVMIIHVTRMAPYRPLWSQMDKGGGRERETREKKRGRREKSGRGAMRIRDTRIAATEGED